MLQCLHPEIALANDSLALSVNEGEYIMISSKVPSTATVTWSSSNEDLVTVSQSGYAMAIGTESGTAVVTASITVNGVTYSDTCTITVQGYE